MDAERLAVIVGMGVVTYLIRALPLAIAGRGVSPALDRYLRHLACALIAGVIAASLFFTGPRFEAAAAPRRAAALLVTVVVALLTGRPIAGMLAGTAVVVALARFA